MSVHELEIETICCKCAQQITVVNYGARAAESCTCNECAEDESDDD